MFALLPDDKDDRQLTSLNAAHKLKQSFAQGHVSWKQKYLGAGLYKTQHKEALEITAA